MNVNYWKILLSDSWFDTIFAQILQETSIFLQESEGLVSASQGQFCYGIKFTK